jgi:transketolase
MIKHDVKEGKGSKQSLEKKWDKAGKAAEKSHPDNKYALQNYIYHKMTSSILARLTAVEAAPNKAAKRAQWMKAYEEELIKLLPQLRGKVDWDTATFFFVKGYDPKRAAETFAENHS